MASNTGTILKVYLLAKSKPGLEEGFVQLWKHKGKVLAVKSAPFNHLDEIGGKVTELLKTARIKWPPKSK